MGPRGTAQGGSNVRTDPEGWRPPSSWGRGSWVPPPFPAPSPLSPPSPTETDPSPRPCPQSGAAPPACHPPGQEFSPVPALRCRPHTLWGESSPSPSLFPSPSPSQCRAQRSHTHAHAYAHAHAHAQPNTATTDCNTPSATCTVPTSHFPLSPDPMNRLNRMVPGQSWCGPGAPTPPPAPQAGRQQGKEVAGASEPQLFRQRAGCLGKRSPAWDPGCGAQLWGCTGPLCVRGKSLPRPALVTAPGWDDVSSAHCFPLADRTSHRPCWRPVAEFREIFGELFSLLWA